MASLRARADLALDDAVEFVLKIYNSAELLYAYRESMVYDALKPYQGNVIPYCYGMFRANERQRGMGLLLERIVGIHLEEYLLSRPNLEAAGIYWCYLRCRQALALLHANGFAFCREYGHNFIMTPDSSLVLVGFGHAL